MKVAEEGKAAEIESKGGKEIEAGTEEVVVAESNNGEPAGPGKRARDAGGRYLPGKPKPGASEQQTKAEETEPKNGSSGQDGDDTERSSELTTEARQRRLVSKLLGKANKLAESKEFKLSAGDLIRLIQLQKDLTPKTPHKVTVQWVGDESE